MYCLTPQVQVFTHIKCYDISHWATGKLIKELCGTCDLLWSIHYILQCIVRQWLCWSGGGYIDMHYTMQTLCRQYVHKFNDYCIVLMVMCPTSLLTECCLFLFVTHSRKPLKYVLVPHAALFGWQLIKHILGIIIGTLVLSDLMQNNFTHNYTLNTNTRRPATSARETGPGWENLLELGMCLPSKLYFEQYLKSKKKNSCYLFVFYSKTMYSISADRLKTICIWITTDNDWTFILENVEDLASKCLTWKAVWQMGKVCCTGLHIFPMSFNQIV